MDLVKEEGVTGSWLQTVLTGLIPPNAFPEEVSLKDFLTIISKSQSPREIYERLVSNTTEEDQVYSNLQHSLEQAKMTARTRREAYEAQLKLAENTLYLQLFKQMASKEQDRLNKKIKKYPESDRYKSRKAILENTIKSIS